MRNTISFLKRYWLLILVVLAGVLFIINKMLGTETALPAMSPSPFSNKVADYNSIQPGKSNVDEINNLLGFPVEQSAADGKITAEYSSSNEFRNNIITIQNGVATLIREVVNTSDNKRAQDIINEFGQAPYRLYKQKANEYFDLYVYPANGIAYLGHEDGTLLEIWYFESTTIENFVTKWATDYSIQKYNGRSQY